MAFNIPKINKVAFSLALICGAAISLNYIDIAQGAPRRAPIIPKIQIFNNQNAQSGGWEYNASSKNADYYLGFDDSAPNFPNIGGAAIVANIGCGYMGQKRFSLYFSGMGSIYNDQTRQIYGNYSRILNTNGNLILLDNNNVPIARFAIGPNSEAEDGAKLVSGSMTNAQLEKFSAAKSIVIDTPRIGGTITAANLPQIIPVLTETQCN